MHFKSDVVAEAVNKIFTQRLAVQVLAVAIDIVHGDFCDRTVGTPHQHRLARLKGRHRGLLRAQNNIVNFPLARGEMAVHRKRARNIGRIHGIFGGRVDHHNIASVHHVVVFRVMQHRGVEP